MASMRELPIATSNDRRVLIYAIVALSSLPDEDSMSQTMREKEKDLQDKLFSVKEFLNGVFSRSNGKSII